MNKTEIGMDIASKLWASEAAIDDATVRTTQLIESMVGARKSLQLSPLYGEVAQARAVEAVSALSEARRAVLAAHAALEALRVKEQVVLTGTPPKEDDGVKPEGKLRVAS